MNYAILEVGSTNTKIYNCYNENINDTKLYTIEFKKNYKLNNTLLSTDIDILINLVNSIELDKSNIYVYGTSVFRNLKKEECNQFLNDFKNKTGVTFNIVSAQEENELTVKGVIADINYNGPLGVMIGGGASTEIAYIENKKIKMMNNQDFGVSDIMEKFPDLALDHPTCIADEVLAYTKQLVSNLNFKADILVLAGGDYLKFYEALNFKMEANNFYDDPKQPYMIAGNDMDKGDIIFHYDISLDELRNNDKENKDWWNGTRGMRFCVKAIFDSIDAKYIIPTRISMVYGIIDLIINNNKVTL